MNLDINGGAPRKIVSLRDGGVAELFYGSQIGFPLPPQNKAFKPQMNTDAHR